MLANFLKSSATWIFVFTALTACGKQGSSSQSTSQGAPLNLSYSVNPANYTYGIAITPNLLTVSKAVKTLSISPDLPVGLSFDPNSGTVTGTPTTITAAADYTVTGTNSYGSNFVNLHLAIVDYPPTASYSGTNPVPAFTKGFSIGSITPTLGGGATTGCTSNPQLPDGLSLSSQCVITGTPLFPTASNNYSIIASNSGGNGSFSLNLTVNDVQPNVSYPSGTYTFIRGAMIAATSIQNSGGAIVSCAVSPALSTGLIFNTTNCQLSGTPSALSSAQTYSVTATNSGGSSTTSVVLSVVDTLPVITYSPASYTLTTGTAVSASGINVVNTGGVITTCAATGLPTGLALDNTCKITGTPTVLGGPTTAQVTATNSAGNSSPTSITFTVNAVAPTINYTGSPYTFYDVTAITPVTPTTSGGAIITCAISPALPTGLSLASPSCTISGTPTGISAASNYVVTATNTGGSSTQTINIQVKEAAPNITYPASTYTFIRATPITPLNVTNTGGPIVSCATFPALPTGLSLSTTTCQITGNPTVNTATSNYTITATNSAGSSAKTLSITVNDTVPSLTYTGSPYVLTNNQPISTIVPTNNGGTVTSCSISPTLPTGLSLSTTCGVSGTPSVLSSATTYTVSAVNAGGSSTATLSIAVNDSAPAIAYSGSPFYFGENVAITTVTPSNSGGAIVSCSISPTIPTGLSFSTTTCQISGTPTVTSATTSYTVVAANSGGTNSTSISITITQLPSITYAGSPYTYTVGTPITALSATNSGGTITSCNTFPNLPAGLSISSTSCQISGDPTTITAAANYIVTASNAGGSSSTSINITVNDVAPAISYSGSPFVFTQNEGITAVTPANTGGTPTSCAITPALSAGLTFNTTTCVISGTPTALHTASNYTVTPANSAGSGTPATVRISVIAQAPVIAYAGSPYTFYKSTAITAQTPSNTGSAIVSCAITPTLPTGLAFSTTTCAISGTATLASAATNYTVTATNTGGNNSTSISITVLAAPIISFGGPYSETINTAISAVSATNTGGAITSCSSSPALPSGLAISSTTCQITGTPTALSAATTYTVTAMNAAGSATATVSVTVKDAVPALTYTGSPYNDTINQTISTVIPTNSGGATTSCSISPALPTGLSLNTTTCSISGTPTALSASTSYTVTATNSGGSSTATLSIAVIATAPAIAFSGSPYTFYTSTAITTQTPSNSGGTIVSCTISPSLPTGLALSSTTCAISGTPTVTSAATSYTITAANTGGSSSASISITVIAAPLISYSGPYTETVNTAITAISATNSGSAITSCSSSPALPSGLAISSTTCQITGTTTTVSAATTYTVTAANAAGSNTATLSITVKDLVPALTYAGSPYTYTLNQTITTLVPTNSGGATTSCAITPALPTGLALNTTTCSVSGTPSALSASTSYTVTATNSGGSSTATLSIAIVAAAPAISFAGSPYTFNKSTAITSQTPANTGGAIVSCAISPSLPTGLSFSTTTCAISGTPTVASAVSSYTVTATNTGGNNAIAISISVLASPSIAYTGSPFTYSVGTQITALSATNSGGTISSCSVSPSLPSGLNISSSTCQITGTPTAVTASASYTITATNSDGSGTAAITIAVNDVAPALTYTGSPYRFYLGQSVGTVVPSNSGGLPTNCSVTPALAAGLSLSTTDCTISGTATALKASTVFTVTASNTGGSSTASVTIAVVAVAPSITYSGSPYSFVYNTTITPQTPSNTGGAIVSCTSSPTLPAGLTIAATTCAISGKPTAVQGATSYTITATNTGGSNAAAISITVTFTAMEAKSNGALSGGPAQLVYFNKSLTGANDVWMTSVDGSSSTNLTRNSKSGVLVKNASVNPNGNQVLFESQASSNSFNIWSIVPTGQMDSPSDNPFNGIPATALTENVSAGLDVGSPMSYSADGNRVTFASKANLKDLVQGLANGSYNIWIMNTDGSNKRPLTQNIGAGLDSLSPVFSPDGTEIYFQSTMALTGEWDGIAAKSNIWKVSTQGGMPISLTQQDSSSGNDCTEPSLSPDGATILFTSMMPIDAEDSLSTNIWSVNLFGSNLTPLTRETVLGRDSKNPSISRDGSAVVFASKQSGENSFNIWTMKIDGSNSVNLTREGASGKDSAMPSYSPDNAHIAFTSRLDVAGTPSSSNNIWIMNSDGSSLTPLTQNTRGGLDSWIGNQNVWISR